MIKDEKTKGRKEGRKRRDRRIEGRSEGWKEVIHVGGGGAPTSP
jgi:hypothetical protein